MFKESELLEMKKVEVQEIAKSLGIARFTSTKARTKDELIKDILDKQNGEENGEEEKLNTEKDTEIPNEKVEQPKQEVKESKVVSEVKKLEKKKLTDEEKAIKKQKYVDDAQVGTLVAFKCDTGRVKSAMIIKRSTSKRRFLLETKYGAKYKVSFEDVLWVRTNKRWPKGIFKLLRGESLETESEE